VRAIEHAISPKFVRCIGAIYHLEFPEET
jgi:hypothetical protein